MRGGKRSMGVLKYSGEQAIVVAKSVRVTASRRITNARGAVLHPIRQTPSFTKPRITSPWSECVMQILQKRILCRLVSHSRTCTVLSHTKKVRPNKRNGYLYIFFYIYWIRWGRGLNIQLVLCRRITISASGLIYWINFSLALHLYCCWLYSYYWISTILPPRPTFTDWK